jgi:hypothetical protein
MYPEVKKLNRLIRTNDLKVSDGRQETEELLEVRFHAAAQTWRLFIEDEYKDFNPENQPLCVYLVLRALEDYQIEPDFLHWCEYYYLDPNEPKWLDYYRELGTTYREIEMIIGKPDSFITTMDYDLRSGPMDELISGTGN